MTFDKAEYAKLSTKVERARYLLQVGVTAELTIDPEKLHPAYVPMVDEIYMASLCGYHGSKEAAVDAGTKCLKAIVAEEV
ncbi:hypothetical protein PRZ61_12410 [Halomonas pacifica]|uniref:hypothetical protein n=1 Tax=Bisbaumannia pacifica TaxID=77098 RepID=UPI00235A29E2|nr:hypothetical protein [Halomonas pacifica]MDC8804244.1 hypothetical protein [Halomonas pacifica]